MKEKMTQNKEIVEEKKPSVKEEKMFKEEMYDRLPFTYKQVDIFIKVFIGFIILFIIFATIVSNM